VGGGFEYHANLPDTENIRQLDRQPQRKGSQPLYDFQAMLFSSWHPMASAALGLATFATVQNVITQL